MITGIVGVVALAAGLEGYFLRTASWLERGLFLAAAFLLIDPGLVTDLVGLGGAGGRAGQLQRLPAGHRLRDLATREMSRRPAVLTLIAAAMVAGTIAYGVLRLYS